jgi:hypothetical protein
VGLDVVVDGWVRYRTDHHAGDRTGILPWSCRSGRHRLGPGRYLVTAAGPNLLEVGCLACRDEGVTPDAWVLQTYGPPPRSVVLDDAPYRDIGISEADRQARRR